MKIVLMWLTHNLGVLPQLMKTAIWYQMIGDIVPRLAQLCDIVLAEQVKFMFFEKATENYKIFTVDLTLAKYKSN